MGTSDLRWLLYTASALSILGTSLVFLEHLQDRRLWRRPARQLLVWLCVTDFMTAVVYLLPYAEQNDKVCFAQAVLGIYFPVASFLWTDCIALYVYLIVSSLNRRSSLLRSSKTLFRLFHFVSWSVPLVCAVAVGLSNHAGQDRYTETSGWCWVKSAEDYGDDDDGTADSEDEARRNELFRWELVGGKLVEWFSILVWCPILYWRCYLHLTKQEKLFKRYDSVSSYGDGVTAEGSYGDEQCAGGGSGSASREVSVGSSANGVDGGRGDGDGGQQQQQQQPYAGCGGGAESSSQRLNSVDTSTHESSVDGGGRTVVNFTNFKQKLFMVPLIFLVLRLPGSLVTVLEVTLPSVADAQWVTWLRVVQVFCDPLQGFCNGLLFVVCSGRRSESQEQTSSTQGGDARPKSAGRGAFSDVPVDSDSSYSGYSDDHDGGGGRQKGAATAPNHIGFDYAAMPPDDSDMMLLDGDHGPNSSSTSCNGNSGIRGGGGGGGVNEGFGFGYGSSRGGGGDDDGGGALTSSNHLSAATTLSTVTLGEGFSFSESKRPTTLSSPDDPNFSPDQRRSSNLFRTRLDDD